MSHSLEAFELDNNDSIDAILVSSSNYLFCWFLYETFDAHDCHDGQSGLGVERTYSNDNLHTCRSRLLYYHDEYPEDIKDRVDKYMIDKNLKYSDKGMTFESKDDSMLNDSSNTIEIECESAQVSFAVGYILKFLDKIVDMNCPIKIKFT